MTSLPDITGKRLIRILRKAGWIVKSQRGSHVKMVKQGLPNFIIVPVHSRQTIPKGTLSNIIKDAGLTLEEFTALLKS